MLYQKPLSLHYHQTVVLVWEEPPPLSSLVSGGPLRWRRPQELQPRKGVWRGGGGEHRLIMLGGEQPGVDPALWGALVVGPGPGVLGKTSRRGGGSV